MRLVQIKDSNFYCDECNEKKDAGLKIVFNYSESIYLCEDHKKELGELLTSATDNVILDTPPKKPEKAELGILYGDD